MLGLSAGEKVTKRTEAILFQELKIAVFSGESAGGFLDEFHELTQVVALGRDHALEANSDAVGGTAASDDSAQGEALHPNLVVGEPEADFYFRSGPDWRSRFNQASADAGIGEIAPDRGGSVVDPKFNGDETLHARMLPAVTAPVRSEEIGFEWRSCRSRGRHRTRGRCGFFGGHILGCGHSGLDLAHRLEQRFFAMFGRGFAIGLQ